MAEARIDSAQQAQTERAHEQKDRPGESVRWDRLLAQATGEPLTATHLARDIAAGLSA